MPSKTPAPAAAPKTPKAAKAPAAPDPNAQAAATKKDHKVIIILAVIAAVIFLVIPAIALTVGGIFLSKKVNESGVKVDTDSKSVSISDKNGNEFSAGGNQKLPSDFPSDIPLYNGDIAATGKVNSDGKSGWTVSILTNDSASQVSDTINKSYSSDGWSTEMTNTSAEGGLLIAKKNDLQVNIFYNSKDGKTSILYTVGKGANQ